MFLETHPVFVTTNISDTQAAAARLGLDATLDLLDPKSPFRCTISRVTLGASEVCHCRHTGRIRIVGGAPRESYLLCLSRRGEIVLESGDKTVVLTPGSAIVLADSDLVAETGPSAELMLVKLEKGAVRAALRTLIQHQIYAPLEFEFSLKQGNAEKFRLLERYLDFLYEEAGSADPTMLFSALALEQAEKLLSTLLLETLPSNYSDELEAAGGSNTPWHLRAADDAIRERLAELTSTAKLAAAIGVSPKTLRRTFVQVKGMTPTRYLRKLRFQRVRHELQQAHPPETVTTIALRWGFSHLGRFAVEYRREFSESPSQTLRAS